MGRKLETWNDRLVRIMRDRGVSNAALGRASGVSRASIGEWVSGATENPKLPGFFKACDALRVRPRWLALGELPMEPHPDDAPPPFTDLVMQIAEMLELRSESAQRKILQLLEDIPPERPTDAADDQAAAAG